MHAEFRRATADDVPSIVRLLADDPLGATRERVDGASTFIPYLTFGGGQRAQIEAVRVAAHLRRTGIGREMMIWSIEAARSRGCHLVQLTTNKERPDARRFYERLGFVASHEGMKFPLE